MTLEHQNEDIPKTKNNSFIIFLIGFIIGTLITSIFLIRLIKFFSYQEYQKINKAKTTRKRSVDLEFDEEKTA
jgi:uncharacterized membrane protein YciS (DUF1049 family)